MAKTGPVTTLPKHTQFYISCLAGNLKGIDWLLANIDQTREWWIILGVRALRATDDVLSGSRVFILMDHNPSVEVGGFTYYTNNIDGKYKQIDQKLWVHGIAHMKGNEITTLQGKVNLMDKRSVWMKVEP